MDEHAHMAKMGGKRSCGIHTSSKRVARSHFDSATRLRENALIRIRDKSDANQLEHAVSERTNISNNSGARERVRADLDRRRLMARWSETCHLGTRPTPMNAASDTRPPHARNVKERAASYKLTQARRLEEPARTRAIRTPAERRPDRAPLKNHADSATRRFECESTRCAPT